MSAYLQAFGQYFRNIVIPSVQASSTCAWCPTNTPADANEVVKNVLNTILIIVVIAAVVYIMIAGLQYVTSQGDATKTKQAMAGITNAIIGLVVAFAAYVLVQLIMNQIGVEQQPLPTV